MAEINSYSDAVSQPAYHKHTNFYPIHEGLEELRSVKPVFIFETDVFGKQNSNKKTSFNMKKFTKVSVQRYPDSK